MGETLLATMALAEFDTLASILYLKLALLIPVETFRSLFPFFLFREKRKFDEDEQRFLSPLLRRSQGQVRSRVSRVRVPAWRQASICQQLQLQERHHDQVFSECCNSLGYSMKNEEKHVLCSRVGILNILLRLFSIKTVHYCKSNQNVLGRLFS